jgi:CRP-like cAMP-binding protein
MGSLLFRQGSVADALFLIEDGRAAVIRDGRRLARLLPGDFFGEIALLRGGARTASVVALTDMRVRVVPRHEFARVLQRLPRLARSLQAMASRRVLALPAQPSTAA